MSLGFILANSAKLSCWFLRKNAPKILTITSAVTAVGACVGTGIATWNSKEVIEIHNADIHELHTKRKETTDEGEKAKLNQAVAKQYAKTAGYIAKNYAIPAIFLVGSVAAGIASNSISQARIAALGASYALLKEVYDKYRSKVVDKYGPEADAEIAYGSYEEITETTDEKGKKKKEKNVVYDPYGAKRICPCSLILGDGIESKIIGDYWNDIAVIQSAVSYYTYRVLAGYTVTAYDFYCGEMGLGVRASKEEIKLWSSWRFSRDTIQMRLDNLKASNRFRKAPDHIKKEMEDKAKTINIGLDDEINKRWLARTEPTITILPDCVPLDYEDTYIYDKQKKEFEMIEF